MLGDVFSNLQLGFDAALTWQRLGFCLLGTVIGTLIGVLPGIGPIATLGLLLPTTFGLDPLSGLIMLAGIYYGAQYGGSTTSILVNMPGESASVVTCLDGFKMAQQGRGGAALSIAALGSLFAGCVGTLLIAGFGPLLGAVTQQFTAAEYFSLMVLGLVMAVVLAHGSVLKACGSILIGVLLGMVGTDVNSGAARYTFGFGGLWDGVDILPLVLGLFGVVEVLRNLENPDEVRVAVKTGLRNLWPTRAELRSSIQPILRGTGLGAALGVLPGGGAVMASFASYTMEKRLARDPSRFGKGAVEGVAGPEAANNAAAQTSFIPLLTLGLPSNPVMALMMGAMMIQGIQPGPAVMEQRPELFWGLIASMWIGNLMLVVINLPLVGLWVRLLSVPHHLFYPFILLFCVMGIYSTSAEPLQLTMLAIFTVLGYLLLRFSCEPAPIILGFLLGPLMEENMRRAMVISGGDMSVFVQRPISASLLGAAVLLVLALAIPQLRKTRSEAFVE